MLSWAVKQLFIWIGIGLLAFGVISSRHDLTNAAIGKGAPLENVAPPANPPRTWDGGREMTIRASIDGHFRVVANVDGYPVNFLVDTGATGVALARDVAERLLGRRLRDADYTLVSHTAGGIVRVAPITLGSVEIGPITVRDLDARVVEKLEGISLLGMEFLRRLGGFEVRGDELKLYW